MNPATARDIALTFTSAIAALACAAAIAQTPGVAPMPPMQTEGAVSYLCGGIGSDESKTLRAAMKNYPLSLLFAAPGGAYEANVRVDLSDAKGAALLSMQAGGPVCLLELPAGSYTVKATGGGSTQQKTATVGGQPVALDFRFAK